jgi:mannose-6-phosphate isomerase-like protein (cupin superfamily)
METSMKKLAVLLLLTPLFAADPQGIKIWKAQELKAFTKSDMLGDFGNHNARMTFRDKDGEAEVHQNWTDVIVVESGEATLMLGGTLVSPQTTGPGEIRGTSAAGAEKRAIAPGDILHIPAGVPHQFFVAPGKKLVYFVLKVPAR